jgi:hypothetical protein
VNLVEKFDITLKPVPEVDNQGEHCDQCQKLGALIAAQIYYHDAQTGEHSMVDCCLDCLVETVRDAARKTNRPLVVEIGEKSL